MNPYFSRYPLFGLAWPARRLRFESLSLRQFHGRGAVFSSSPAFRACHLSAARFTAAAAANSPAALSRRPARAFDPRRQALPDMAFSDRWISRSLARSSPRSSLAAGLCSCGRVLATAFFQLILSQKRPYLSRRLPSRLPRLFLSVDESMPMPGTLDAPAGCVVRGSEPPGENGHKERIERIEKSDRSLRSMRSLR